MRLYINHFNLDVLQNIMNLLKELYLKSETYIQIYALDGIYKIDENKIKKLNSIDSDIKIIQNYYEKFTLIMDTSYFVEELVNQIDSDHISKKTKKCIFRTNPNSKIDLVIEGEILENNNFFQKNNTEYGMKPNELYFEMANNIDINDALVKKEIIEFLSRLN